MVEEQTVALLSGHTHRSGRQAAELHAVRPSIGRILSGMTGTPAYVRNAKMEVESTRWARRKVHFHGTARKTLRSPLVGEIELTGDALEVPGERLTVIAYTAEPGSQAEEQLAFLASWTAAHASPHGAELRSSAPLT